MMTWMAASILASVAGAGAPLLMVESVRPVQRNPELELARVRRGFAFAILLAYSCRERGMVLVTRNGRDMARIRTVFAFQFEKPYPESG